MLHTAAATIAGVSEEGSWRSNLADSSGRPKTQHHIKQAVRYTPIFS